MKRSVLLCLAVVAIQASAAIAQTTQPWTGIAANEARANNGQQFGYGDNYMWGRTMSDDGRFVVFDSSLSHLINGDTNNWNDVFLRDRQTGELTRVSVASDGSQGNHYSAAGTISRNGRHIAFYSCATNFDAADTNNSCDLFIHDRINGTTVRANLGPNGEQATNTAQHQFNLSADGRYLAFNAGFNADRRVWLRDRDTDENGVFDEPGTAATTLISQDVVGSESLRSFENAAISGDGRWIAYVANVGDGNTNEIGARMFLHDRVGMNTSRVDRPMANGTETYAYASGPDFSDAGLLVYASNENNLAEGDTDGQDDIYVFNVFTGGNVPIELTHPGAPALEYEWAPAISADGRYVTFMGVTVGEWSNFLANVYVVDRQTGQSYDISVRPDGSRDDHTGAPAISGDGLSIAFSAGAEMLVNSWGNTGIFVATNVALSPSEIDVPADGGTFTIDLTVPDGIAWTLNTQGATGVDFSATSGVGPATIDLTVWENGLGEAQDFYVLLGTELVILHQAVMPRVYGTWPYEGPVEGGTPIQIYGEAFLEGATVTIGGNAATDVVVLDSQHITATTPAHPGLGWVDVTVTNPGGASGTFMESFLYTDLTPPVVTYQIAGTPGQNGWYTSDVTVTWTYEDPESTVEVIYCFNPYTQTTDESQFAICYVTSAGGETIVDVEVKKDTMPPVIAISPSVSETYFQGQVVPIAHYCADFTSGIATCTPNQSGPNLDTASVGTFEFSVTAVDMAGHSTTVSTSYTVRMTTAITLLPTNGVYGAPVSLRATLLGGGATLAGKTIAFFVDNIAVGTAITSGSGEATLSLAPAALSAGTYQARAEFAGDETAFPSTSFSDVVIEKVTPILTWANPAFIVQGTALSGTQLNATSSVAGAFGYDPDAGAILAPGTHTLTAYFSPQDSVNYNTATKTVTIKVKGVPVLSWSTPPPIRINQYLTAAHLDATADVAGTFVYTPGLGWNWNVVGPQTLSVTFTPANSADYTNATATVVIDVLKGIPQINFPLSDPIGYMAPLGATQLNASSQVPGTFTYTPPAGTVLPVGTHTVTATLTPSDLTRWEIASVTKSQVIYKADPFVSWDFPAAIPYGTPLGPAQQNATSNVPGTYQYFPPAGTILEVGQHWMSVILHPTDTANYNNGSTYVSITVGLGASTVSWNNPAPIVYPQALGGAQLNATASLPGTFIYTPAPGHVLSAGTHTLNVWFSPTDSSHYAGASKSVTIVVGKRTPSITWNQPAGLTYGAALSASQLNATANAAGTFAYSPPLGTVLVAGTHTLSVEFTPYDTANNFSATSSVTINVAQATPTITWPSPGGVYYGTPLSGTQLNASASVAGTFEYLPASGAVMSAGTHTLTATFTPADSNYAVTTATRSFTVVKAGSGLAWSTPAPVPYPTALSAAQLNATAVTPGTFNYSEPLGTVLAPGVHPIEVNFTPTDADNYQGATLIVYFTVNQTTPVISWTAPAGIVYGTALSETQLNATANVSGTFTYSPSAGSILQAGTQSVMAIFHATDPNYNVATAIVSITVAKATPVVSWATPSGITYGQTVSNIQLNATANVPGSYVYLPASGTVLNAGSHTLSVTFTPADPSYNTATASVTLNVAKAMPVLSWANPAFIQYGTPLSGTQLNASANVAGTFAYSPAAGTVLPSGGHTLTATFAPADPANYNTPAPLSKAYFVTTRPLTLQVDNTSKVYGEALPAFTTTGTGFVNGDTLASLGSPGYSTAATATSAPGTYSVSLFGVSSTNYSLTVESGTLTVTKASTSLVLTTTPNPSNNNQSVQLRAVVSAVAPGAGTATGTVEFRENGTLLGTATLVNGIATMNKNFKRGTHPLTATYAGNTSFNGSSGSVTHQTQ